jgi:hypothetical protein
VQGVQGLQGNDGLQGSTGVGIQGVQGVQGLQGNDGLQGSTGAGIQGVQGLQGLQGNDGLQGSTGAGIQGVQGLQGLQGNDGLQGSTGAGIQGVQGVQGNDGLQGSSGAGIQGVQGVQGTDGGMLTPSTYLGQAKLTANQNALNNTEGLIKYVVDIDPQGWVFGLPDYKFQPTIAGYYLVDAGLLLDNTGVTSNTSYFAGRLNGTEFARVESPNNNTAGQSYVFTKIVYLNGSTDYLDFVFFQDTGSTQIISGTASGNETWYSATLLAFGQTGSQGVQGLQGSTGAGIQGLQGVQGTDGVQGLQGLQGVQGLQGTQTFKDGNIQLQWTTGFANLTNGVDNPIPFNSAVFTTGSDLSSSNLSTTNAGVLINSTGVYLVTLRAHFFDLGSSMTFSSGLLSSTDGTTWSFLTFIGLMRYEGANTNQIQNSSIIIQVTSVPFYIQMYCNPSANSPFPADLGAPTTMGVTRIGN